MRKEKEYSVDCVLSLNDFYLIHAGLRLLASNLDYMRWNILNHGDDMCVIELDLEHLADKIDIYIEQLEKQRDVYN